MLALSTHQGKPADIRSLLIRFLRSHGLILIVFTIIVQVVVVGVLELLFPLLPGSPLLVALS